MRKLLRLLHTVSWAHACSGSGAQTELPEVMDLFCNVLLGRAKPPPPEHGNFEATLSTSVERALK